eukprot:1713754-Pyramimonas_sp.AAC.1
MGATFKEGRGPPVMDALLRDGRVRQAFLACDMRLFRSTYVSNQRAPSGSSAHDAPAADQEM